MTRAKATKVEQVALADMRPAGWNPRIITEFQLEALQRSMREFGVVEPVVLNADGTILGGHQRYAAAQALGLETLPAVRVDLDATKARMLNLALNRISGEWDLPLLAEVVASVEVDAEEWALAGFPEAEIAHILASAVVVSPEAFPPPNTETDHRCPSCSYEWSGPCR